MAKNKTKNAASPEAPASEAPPAAPEAPGDPRLTALKDAEAKHSALALACKGKNIRDPLCRERGLALKALRAAQKAYQKGV